jgi:hypothetical protein
MSEAAPSIINADPNTPAPAAGGTPEGTKPEGEAGKTTEPQDGKADKAKVGAPEKYADFKLPDGAVVDKVAMEKFLPLAKKLNLNQDQAQELVDFHSEFAAHGAKAEQEAWDNLQADWVKTAKNDKEIGGPAFNENVGYAAKALKQFGNDALKEAMDATGVGNHPEFIRVFAKIGKALSEDKFHVSNADVPSTPKSLAERLFPNQAKQE